MSRNKLDPNKILQGLVKKVGPTERWKGQCFALASQAVNHKLVPGTAVYGMWHGPIAKGSYFEERGSQIPFVNHGWVVLPDGQVCDPTRWVFENVEPYVYIGASDHYDEGANRLREHVRPPSFDAEEQTVQIEQHVLAKDPWNFLEKLLRLDQLFSDEDYEAGTVTIPQLFWVGNRPPQELGEHAPAIYAAIKKLGYGAAIPFDNQLMVKRLFPTSAEP